MRPLTADARAALSRREFMKSSGALIVGLAIARERGAAQELGGAGSNQLDSWIAIAQDGSVTAYAGKCELGQGLFTAQTQLIAEELCVAFDRVKLVQCETGVTPDQGTTSGAQSHPTNFNRGNLALAAATAREALLRRACERLGVPAEQLVAKDGVVTSTGDAGKRIAYGDLIGGHSFHIALDPNAKRRRTAEWTVLGKPVPRVEIPAMATGRFEYVHNVRVDRMLHGQVVRPPSMGASLESVDEASVAGMPGLVKVVVKKDFVGVVAQKPWQALAAASKLKTTWKPGPALPKDIHEYLRTAPARDSVSVNSGDVDGKLAGAARVMKATYRYPYQMHGSFSTSCAVADVRGGKATLWSATQGVYPLRSSVAMVLGLQPENVRVLFRMGSGCYGLNGADTVSYDAALLSQAVEKPVRVQLTRKDEMAWENYGVAYVIDQRAGIDAAGTIVAWDHESWSPSLGGRPGGGNPGNVVTGALVGFEPAGAGGGRGRGGGGGRGSAAAPARFGNGSNAVPSYVKGCAGSSCGGTGSVASERVVTHGVRSPFWTGPLRSPARLQNTFAHESFLDEIAASLKADPVEYRLRHLKDPRLIEVVKAAAKTAGWEARPSPRPGLRKTGVSAGRGMACVLYEGDNGYCAMVAEVEVAAGSGAIRVKRFVIANDCGPISNPDGLRNQLEGGALHGMSRALLEEVTWDDRKITSIDWTSYRPLELSAEVPRIETVLIDHPEGKVMGAGETAVTVAAGAIANAVFDATGARIRQIPFTRERVKAALDART
jgi:nicotinate dehydrogenase subunit B